AGLYFAALTIAVEVLANLIFGDGPLWTNTKPGQISKDIMAKKQQYIAAHGAEAEVAALEAAPDFRAAILALAHAPGGTSGQVQFGVANEYAGMHLEAGVAGNTETGGWAPLVAAISDPEIILTRPDLVAAFITNFWVQLGQTGATTFDPGATLNFQAILLSKLPNSPDYQQLRQLLLNRWPIVDPRNQAALAATLSAVPALPVDNLLRVGNARIPVDHT